MGMPLVGQGALVLDGDVDALVEVGQLAHTLQQRVVVVFGSGEDGAVWVEGDAGAGLVGRAHLFDGVERLAFAVFLLVDLPTTVDVDNHVLAEGVDAAHTHAVQTAGHLVAAFVELAACMQHGHHHFEGRTVLLFVHVHRDAAAIILNSDTVIFVDAYVNLGAIPGQGLVDGVVHHLVHQMVQAAEVDVADVHGRTYTHRLKAFQYGNITRAVFVLLCCIAHI